MGGTYGENLNDEKPLESRLSRGSETLPVTESRGLCLLFHKSMRTGLKPAPVERDFLLDLCQFPVLYFL